MAALLSQAIVWSVRECGDVSAASSNPIAGDRTLLAHALLQSLNFLDSDSPDGTFRYANIGLHGLQAVLDELTALRGSKEDAMDALVSDGDAQYIKV